MIPRRTSITWSAPAALLAGFIAWATLSVVWSDYRGATLLAIAVLMATTFAGYVLLRLLGWVHVTSTLSAALFAIVVLSLTFEFVVEIMGGQPILPLLPINVEPGAQVPQAFYWSRGVLFEGGRIQGIVGNSNLLGFVALLLVIVAACQLAARTVSTTYGACALTLGLTTLALTRSSTVIVASAVALLTLLLIGRRSRIAALVVTGIAVVIGLITAPSSTPLVLSLLNKSEDLTGRLDIWASVSDLFSQRPVIGWGWTSYWQPWVPLFDGLAQRNGVIYLQAHNAFLDVAFQLGSIGLVLFLAFVAATCLAVVRRGVAAEDPTWNHGERIFTPSTRSLMDTQVADRRTRVLTKVLPALLLAALLVQALAESRLLVEGNWALLCIITLASTKERRDDATSTRSPAGRS